MPLCPLPGLCPGSPDLLCVLGASLAPRMCSVMFVCFVWQWTHEMMLWHPGKVFSMASTTTMQVKIISVLRSLGLRYFHLEIYI